MNKNLLLGVLLGVSALSSAAEADRVSGYYRANGTYVAPYYRGGGSSGGSSAYTAPTGKPCGNSYISADKTCRIGTSSYKTSGFSSCDEANSNGLSNIKIGTRAYSTQLDRDNDGIACESGGGDSASSASSASSAVRTGTSARLVSDPSDKTASMKYEGGCPVFSLGKRGISIKIPASFPNPVSYITTSGLICGGYSIKYSGESNYYELRKVTIQGPSWRAVWKLIMANESGFYNAFSATLSGSITIDGGEVGYIDNLDALDMDKGAVIGMSINSAKLMPILFNGKVTKQLIGKGNNRIYLKGIFASDSYKQILIDTNNNAITLSPEEFDMAKVGMAK